MRSKIFVLSLLFVLIVSPSAWPADYAEGEVLAVFRVPEGVSVSAAEVSVAGAEVAETFETLSEIEGKVFVLVRSGAKTTDELIAELKARPTLSPLPRTTTHIGSPSVIPLSPLTQAQIYAGGWRLSALPKSGNTPQAAEMFMCA